MSTQPPQMNTAARIRSVRAARQDTHTMNARATSAAGSSQLIWRPNSDWNSLNTPVAPPVLPRPPVSSPSSLPRPLYPKASSRMLLFLDSPQSGRRAAGTSSAAAPPPPGPAPDAAPCQQQLPQPLPETVGSRPQVGHREPGHHQEGLQHLGQE